jgi:hypothetical protein
MGAGERDADVRARVTLRGGQKYFLTAQVWVSGS